MGPTTRPARKSEWTPHIWEGVDGFTWAKLLADNRCRVHWSKLYVAFIVTPVSAVHTALRCVQNALYSSDIARTPVQHAPLFILGHWRAGTTLLHELLIADPAHSFPNYYECFAPDHFLLTGRWFPRWLWWMMPSRRPMDDVRIGWDRPQEDEFAACMLGLHTPYRRIAFPNSHPGPDRYDLGDLAPVRRRDWQRRFRSLIHELNYAHPGRRLVLKSPPHTARIAHLLELFPDARFVYIARDPYVVYPSTLRMWTTLYATHGLQRPPYPGLDERVLATFEHLDAAYLASKSMVAPNRLLELRYEDLMRDPLGELRSVYARLELGDFERARPYAEKHLANVSDYATNRYELSPADTETVTRRWGDYARRYGYPLRG